jgi:hypothetical protein
MNSELDMNVLMLLLSPSNMRKRKLEKFRGLFFTGQQKTDSIF